MIRTALTAAAIAAVTMIALATAAPVLAAPSPDGSTVTAEATMESAGSTGMRSGFDTAPSFEFSGPSESSSHLRSERPNDQIADDAQTVIDIASAAASVLSFDRMLIALFVVLGMIGAFGIATVVIASVVVGRANR